MNQHRHTFPYELPDETEVEVTILFRVTTRGHPGVSFGPPEHCFPPEAMEIEIDKVFYQHSSSGEAEEVTPRLSSDLLEAFEAEVLENWEDFPDEREFEREPFEDSD